MMRLGSLAALALGMAGLGCQASAAALVYTPYQGVNIDSSSLVAPYGCGMGPGQVYRYVATLVNVPIVDGGDASDASGADAGPGTILTTGVFDCFADGVFQGTPPAPATFALTIYALTYSESVAAGLACDPEASPCVPPELDAGAQVAGYSWTTTCTASAETSASVTAQCGPLLPSSADAGTDAGADAGTDADADADAGADVATGG
jgi:hypothetical protein